MDIYGESLSQVVETKFLGITFDSKLKFKDQFSSVENSLVEKLKVIKTLAHQEWGLSQTTLISIYKSLLRSLVEYSSTIFYLDPTSSTKR